MATTKTTTNNATSDIKEKEENQKDWDIIYNEFERLRALKQSDGIQDLNLVDMRGAELTKLLNSNPFGGRLVMVSLSKTSKTDRYDVKANDIIQIFNILKLRSNQYEKEKIILPKNRKDIHPIQAIIHLTLTKCGISPPGLQQISSKLLNSNSYQYLLRLNLSNIGLCYVRNRNQKNADQILKIQLKSIIYLTGGLKTNKTLESLMLDQNSKIPPDGLKILLNEGLLHHPTLKSFSFKSNQLNALYMNEFRDFLNQNPLLQRLYLDRCTINSFMFNILCDGLYNNSNLCSLSLKRNDIGDIGIQSLCNVLAHNKKCNINTIDLFENDLNDKSGEYFGYALSNNNSLTKLDLASNKLRDNGVISLCNGLIQNQSLWRLRLADNDLTYKCCSALSDVLSIHCNLSVLELYRNRLADNVQFNMNGICILSVGVSQSLYLKELNLSETYPGYFGAKALSEAIKKQIINVDKLEKNIKKWILNSPILRCDDVNKNEPDIIIPIEIVNVIVSEFAGFHKLKRLQYRSNVIQYSGKIHKESQPLADVYSLIFDKFGYQINIMW